MPQSREITEVEDTDGFLINIGEANRELGRFYEALGAIDSGALPDKARDKISENASMVLTLLADAKVFSAPVIRKAGQSLRDSLKGTAAEALENHFLFRVLGSF
jgi:hypothetical protein